MNKKKRYADKNSTHIESTNAPLSSGTHAAPNMNAQKIRTQKIRADQLLFEQGLAQSREQAKSYIMAGKVYVGEPPVPVHKAGHAYPADTVFKVTGIERFASRGAYKLLTAIEHFSIDVNGLTCLDAGASTGGFTDCLLQHGAAKVYAVDVGHGQLHEKLRQDPRVINLEKTNLRLAAPELIPEKIQLIVADVSFISLCMVLPACMPWLEAGGRIIALIKPQFELGANQTDKGVVKDPELRQAAVDKVVNFCQNQLNLHLVGIVPSAILGPKGNQEYLAYFQLQSL